MFTEARFQVTGDIALFRFLVSSLAGAGVCALFLLWSWKIQCQLTILSNVLISHQPRDGWACYSHILAGFGWQPLATLVDCGFLTHDLVWNHLPLLAYCPEGLRDTLTWSASQTPEFQGKGLHASYCQGPRKSTTTTSTVWLPCQAVAGRALAIFRILATLAPPSMVRDGTQWVYDPYHIPLPAMSRKVLKLRVGSSWLQTQVMVGSWMSGLSVDHTLLFHVQLFAWIEAGQYEGKIPMSTPKKITGPTYKDPIGVVGTVHIPVLCFPGTGLPRNTQLPFLGTLPFPPLPLSAICTACAHNGPPPTVATVPRDYHKHLPLRSWRW